MFRHIRDVETVWRQETVNTLKVLDAIPDAAAHQAVDEQHRDLKRLAWHLCETIAELPANMGLHPQGFPGEPFQTPPPGSMKEIRDTYATLSASFLETLKHLNDMALAATYPFYGDTWTGAFALWVLVSHQTHHRGQMTVLMRQAHLKVPEVCGPVKESWGAMGIPEPTV